MNAKTCLIALATIAIAAEVHAQEQAPQEVVAPVADATYRAVHDRLVALRTRDGAELVGQVLAEDSATVTIALQPSRRLCTLAKFDVVDVRLVEVPAAAAPVDLEVPVTVRAAAPAPDRERHFGLNFGFSPSVDLDVDAGMFHGFVNANLVLPMASDGQVLGFGAGGGVSFRIRPQSRWRLDVFAAVTPARFGNYDGHSDWVVGLGVGFGAHCTLKNGFTVGFKAPVLGYSVGNTPGTSSGSAVGGYYLSGLMGLPIVSLGYRF